MLMDKQQELESLIKDYQDSLPMIDPIMAKQAKISLEGEIVKLANALGFSVNFDNYKVNLVK